MGFRLKIARLAVEGVSGVAISFVFSFMMFPFTIIIFSILGLFLIPISILVVNLILGFFFIKRSLRVFGVSIIATGSVLAVYFFLRIYLDIPAYLFF